MTPHLAKLHATLEKIADLDDEQRTKLAVSELPELPAPDWSSLQQALRANKFEVREMSVYPADFGHFAAPNEKLKFDILKFAALGVPLAAIVLGIVYSGWSLLLLPLAVLPLQLAKRLYRRVLAESATASEPVFAFLFSRNMIYLYGDGKSWHHDNRTAAADGKQDPHSTR